MIYLTTRIRSIRLIILRVMKYRMMNTRNKINRTIIHMLCVAAFWSFFSETKGQNQIYKVFEKSEWEQYHDSLYSNFSTKKRFVKEFELQSLIALSYYPELKDVPITFRYLDIRTTMEVRPEFFSAIKNHNRSYIIFIGTNTHKEGVLLKEVSFNAQIGVIGHELAHIMDFEQRSVKSLFLLGLDYVILRNHAKYEKSIDAFTIKQGLGWQELEFADYMENKSKASVRYKRFKHINYLSSSDIEAEIAKMKMYSSFTSSKKMNDSLPEKQ